MNSVDIEGRDIGINLLKPLHEREINFAKNSGFRKIVSSMKAIGMIEPVAVYQENGHYVILDGFLRYKACEELQIETVPCILYRDKQAYVFNRNVNRLSAFQEMRMLRKATESIPEPEIAGTLGLKTIRYRLSPDLLKQLHPKVIEAFKSDLIPRPVAIELTYVTKERQAEIFSEMERIGDYSATFCRSLVLKTPQDMKNPSRKHRLNSWAEQDSKRKDIVARLEKAENQHDFYAALYRQYTTDLLKTTFYVRKLVTNKRIAEHLEASHPDELKQMQLVVSSNMPE